MRTRSLQIGGNATGKMTLGQVSEVLFMLALPVFLNRFGIKATLVIGMAAWVVRYALFAFGNADEFVHAYCWYCTARYLLRLFFVSGQIYINAKAGENVKSAAQGLITLATYGVGMLVGFAVAGAITDTYTMKPVRTVGSRSGYSQQGLPRLC